MADKKTMGGSVDETKGRAKKAWGEITDDREKKSEGELDKLAGKLKEGVDRAKEKARDLFERDKAH